MARRRPTAFEVSFPGEAPIRDDPVGSLTAPAPHVQSAYGSVKRKSDVHGPGDSRAVKRHQLPPVAYYVTRPNEIPESKNLIVPGEDPDAYGEGGGEEGEKPIRVLSDFSIFDAKHRYEMVYLNTLDEEDRVDRHIQGVGFVSSYVANVEDDGQEDDLDAEVQYVKLDSIICFVIDNTRENEPFYIETEFAWYRLKSPSRLYEPYFRYFYTPRRIAQLVVSSAVTRPLQNHAAFISKFIATVDIFGRTYQEEDLWDAIREIQDAVEDYVDPAKIKLAPIVRHILRKAPVRPDQLPAARPKFIQKRRLPQIKTLLGNLDLAVLKTENHNPTHVTPLIASLAQGFVREELIVIGPPPVPQNKAILDVRKKKAHTRLCDFIKKAKKPKKAIDWRREDRIQRGSRYVSVIEIERQKYYVGDVVVVPMGPQAGGAVPLVLPNDNDIPLSATLPDYFWFAKIIYINSEEEVAHVQWFEHGSKTVLQEFAHLQELYITDICGSVSLQAVAGKVTVHERPNFIVEPEDFFCKFAYDEHLSTFTSINTQPTELVKNHSDKCPVCLLLADRNDISFAKRLEDDNGVLNGVGYNGRSYHLDDFVLFRSEAGPAHIGYITNISFPERESANVKVTVTLRWVGRISSLAKILPPSVIKEERHVFLTDEELVVSLQDLIRVCYVFPFDSLTDVRDWISLSPDHFYIRYTFPSMTVKSWNDKRDLRCDKLQLCAQCCRNELQHRQSMHDFLTSSRNKPLRTMDLFGGVGAFSRGLAQGSGILKVTHAIEISPSAAKTFMRNSAHTVVYNQCANIMLRYAIKTQEGHHPMVPKQIYDDKIPVPEPLKAGAVDVVVAGFPCQSHSDLNMFKDADDVKSNLILNAVSWVDYLKPKLCYFENVQGFLHFNLNAVQAGPHRLEGGIPMGGLKLLLRSMLEMNYQARYGLMQAGHYGTPQARVRFFLVAARDGLPLPEFPQPTHDFPLLHGLQITLPTGKKIRPIRTTKGIAPHPPVTIDDAIGDLPRFDWKHPNPLSQPAAVRFETRERELTIPAFACKKNSTRCGYVNKEAAYHSEPKTSYQQQARQRPTTDLQQFTKCLLPKKVERVLSIPLKAGADYRDLKPNQYEWQFANPSSSVARANYRPGLYGRLDKDGFFPTTVTNIDPTAKQSKVLNPYCKRMVTVRELARSQGFPDHFVFDSIGDNIVTMHRQIGNAVPWPMGVALGRALRDAFFEQWQKEDAMDID